VKKSNGFISSANDNNVKYILTQPARLSSMSIDDLEEVDAENGWREKSRQLQARRWRKMRHQVV